MMTQIEDQTPADREPRIEVLRAPEELDLASADGRYGLIAPQPPITKILRIGGLDWRMPVYSTIDDALEHLAPRVRPPRGGKAEPPNDG